MNHLSEPHRIRGKANRKAAFYLLWFVMFVLGLTLPTNRTLQNLQPSHKGISHIRVQKGTPITIAF